MIFIAFLFFDIGSFLLDEFSNFVYAFRFYIFNKNDS